jgi:hypothetical protein
MQQPQVLGRLLVQLRMLGRLQQPQVKMQPLLQVRLP